MVRLIIGLKGSGKTKQLIAMVNKSVETSPGNVACIEKGKKLIFDVRHKVRLIDTEDYSIGDANELYGMICGVLATNYDIKDLYIDSSLKICKNDIVSFEEFVERLDKITNEFEINCITTASIAPEDLPKSLEKYLF